MVKGIDGNIALNLAEQSSTSRFDSCFKKGWGAVKAELIIIS